MRKNTFYLPILLLLPLIFFLQACKVTQNDSSLTQKNDPIEKTFDLNGQKIQMSFEAGKAHNYPSLAIWLETTEQKMIQTLFVTKSVANGYYRYGDAGNGHWLKTPGPSVRPASLPVWLHKNEFSSTGKMVMPSPEKPIPDAYSGATPSGDFAFHARAKQDLPNKFKVLVEVNQPWDWNDFYTNDKYINDVNYKTSAQPSIIYAVDVDLNDPMPVYYLNPIGHGHYSGDDGRIYTDLSGFTSALKIFEKITLVLK